MSWPLVKLGDICTFVNGDIGKNYPSSSEFVEEGIPFINAGDLIDNQIDKKRLSYISSDKFDLLSSGKVCKDDLLFCLRGSLGKFAIVDDITEGAIASSLVIIRAGNKITTKYLFEYLRSSLCENEITKFANGAAQPNLSGKDLKDFQIPLPSLEEQKRVAAILDKADSLRRKNQQAIQLADQFLRAVFFDMFGDPVTNPKGWERCKFECLIDMVTYGLTVRPEYLIEGVPLISAREIRSGQINFEGAPKISEKDFEKLSDKTRPKLHDILFSKTGSIGHCAIVENSLKFAVTQNAARIVPNIEKCEPLFLLSLLRTNYFFDLANREAKGNAVKDLQLGVMKEFPVYAPPLDIQRKYVELFKRHKSLSSMSFNAQLDGNEFFNSISQRAFAGEL